MIDYAPLTYRVDPMRSDDIGEVMQIEHVAFSAPWSARAYDYELHYNEMAHYFVARPRMMLTGVAHPPLRGPALHPSVLDRLLGRGGKQEMRIVERPPVVGYCGLWLMVDEAHISTIASHPDWRRRGIGELLLLAMIDTAADIGASVVTLEVRVTNAPAQTLYRKYLFDVVGLRKRYYSDNGEDAYIMTTPQITTSEYRHKLQSLKAPLFGRLTHGNTS